MKENTMMFDWNKAYNGNLEWLPHRTILLTKHGSHAYGLNTPESDLDIKGIAVPPEEYFYGFVQRFEQAESKQTDLIVYDIRKFFNLAADCNPSIIEVLWTDEEDLLLINSGGRILRTYREAFLSQKAKYTFSGYAVSQLKRIKRHRQWLLNPPQEKPTRLKFGLPETALLPKDQLGAVEALGEEAVLHVSPNVMAVYEKERAYHNALREWDQYQNWKKTRNPARAELEAKYGYDCKHAMHLVRLMRMCEEILREGKVQVKRQDRDELLAIRNGAWKYDDLVEYAEHMDTYLDTVMKESSLPKKPDRGFLDSLCQGIVEDMLFYGKKL